MIRRCPSCRERYELPAGANRDGNVMCPGCGGVLMPRRKSLAERMIAQARQPAADANDAAARREHHPKMDATTAVRWRMKIHGRALEAFDQPLYLKGYDVNAMDGVGTAELTADPSRALDWPDMETVIAVWKMRSTVRPNRPDGKPNRPLTAYTIEPEAVPVQS